MIRRAILAAVLGASSLAHAWPLAQLPAPEPAPEPEPPEPAPAPPAVDPELPTLEELEQLLEKQARRLDQAEAKVAELETVQKEVSSLLYLRRLVTAYIDVGAFAVGGDGTGFRRDFLHTEFPGYRDSVAGQWVFMGDPFTTMINTLGEPAETGSSREVAVDSVNSGGRPAVLVNTIGLSLARELAHGVSVMSLVQFLPRPGPDQLEVALAYVGYRPFPDRDLSFQVGKIESVLGVEYRTQDAPRRIGVTPSLIGRYTSGRPLGIAGRLVHGRNNVSAAITNGNNFEERFEPKPELKASRYPTLSAHVQHNLPIGHGLELGLSGMLGPQDQQRDADVLQWHWGIDVRLIDLHGWDVIAEYVHGRQDGARSMPGAPACDRAKCLAYKGAYVLAAYRFEQPRWLRPYARVDWRDATHRDGANFVYEASSVRVTLGTQLEVTSSIIAKVEYNLNRELGVPHFPHDVLTTSLVVSTE